MKPLYSLCFNTILPVPDTSIGPTVPTLITLSCAGTLYLLCANTLLLVRKLYSVIWHKTPDKRRETRPLRRLRYPAFEAQEARQTRWRCLQRTFSEPVATTCAGIGCRSDSGDFAASRGETYATPAQEMGPRAWTTAGQPPSGVQSDACSSHSSASCSSVSATSAGSCAVRASAACTICERLAFSPCSVSNRTRQTSSCCSICDGT